MKKYMVNFESDNTGTQSPIDVIIAPDDYTPELYKKDCEENGVIWGEGIITFVEMED